MGKGSGNQEMEVTAYRMSIHAGLCLSGVDSIRRIFFAEKLAWSGNLSSNGSIAISKPDLFGGEKKEGGVEGTVYFLKGGADQVLPDGLASRMGLTGANCPAYRHLTSIFLVGEVGTSTDGSDWESTLGGTMTFLGELVSSLRRVGTRFKGFLWGHNTPFIKDFWAEVDDYPRTLDDVLGTSLAVVGNDANPAHIIYECLIDPDFGKGTPAASVNASGSFAAAAQTLFDESFGMSITWTRQSKIEVFIQEVLDHIQATCFVNPVTGQWELVLFRDDYDVETIATINSDNATMSSFQRKAWGELANEVTVTWTNPDNEKSETITLQNLASIEAQGTINASSREFKGLRNSVLATSVCARELRQSGAPLAVAEVEMEMSSSVPTPGSVRRLDWPEYDQSGLVMRVMNVDFSARSSKFVVSLMEDVFSLSKPSLPVQPGTGWESSSAAPQEVTSYSIFTLPYALTTNVLASAGDDALEYPETLAAVLAYQGGSDVLQIDLLTEVVLPNGGEFYQDVGARHVGTLGALTADIAAELETSIPTPPGAEIGRTPVEGGFAYMKGATEALDEICLVHSDPGGGWKLQRGILDTTPKAWSAGTVVWFFENAEQIADVSRVRGAGETATYKMLGRTSLGVLSSDDVSAVSAVLSERPHRPLRPANVKVEGTAFGSVSLTGLTEVAVTWARRNRLTEDSIPLAWDDGDVVAEAGQMTVVRALDASGTVLKLWLDVPGTSLTIPVSDFDGETAVYLQVFSARDDLASLQSFNIWLLGDGVSQPTPPGAGSDLDSSLPGTSGLLELTPENVRNLCLDPYFQNQSLWGFGTGPWAAVSRLGSGYPLQLGAPKVAILTDTEYSGSTSKVLTTPILSGLFGDGVALLFSAKAVNAGAGSASITVEVSFHNSASGAQVGSSSTLTWGKGDSTPKELVVTPPAGADSRRFRVYNESGVAWAGECAISDIQLVAYTSPNTANVGGRTSDEVNNALDSAVAGVRNVLEQTEHVAEVIMRDALDRREEVNRRVGEVFDAFGTASDFIQNAVDAQGLAAAAQAAAETASVNAATSADAASTSATTAAGSATTAGTSATAAATSATNASTAANDAGDSAAAANTSATTAASAAGAAGTSATAAASSATAAAASAVEGGEFATAAELSATNASTSASAAGTSATNAAASETNASGSASSAASSASAAAMSASNAGDSASAASTSASSAATAATSAGTAATAADTSATNAATSASNASTSASAASASATTAAGSASAAGTSETNAASSASAAGTSASAASTSASNAASSSDAAGSSATAAAGSATTASSGASTATTKASEASTSASNAATSASAASTSASTASGHATTASGAASSATTSAASAATSSTLAATYGASAKQDVQSAESFFTTDLDSLLFTAGTISYWTNSHVSGVGYVVASTTSTSRFLTRARFIPTPERRYRITARWRFTTGSVGTVKVGVRTTNADGSGSPSSRLGTITASTVNTWIESSYEITATAAMALESWRPSFERTGATGNIQLSSLVWQDMSALRAAGEDGTVVYSTADAAYAARLIQVSAGAASASISFAAAQADGGAASRIVIAAQTVAFGTAERVEITDAGALYGWNAALTVKQLEWDPAGNALRIRKLDGTMMFDSADGGMTSAGLKPNSVTTTDFTTTTANSPSWTTYSTFTNLEFARHTTSLTAGSTANVDVMFSRSEIMGLSNFAISLTGLSTSPARDIILQLIRDPDGTPVVLKSVPLRSNWTAPSGDIADVAAICDAGFIHRDAGHSGGSTTYVLRIVSYNTGTTTFNSSKIGWNKIDRTISVFQTIR
jgi:hypothetical protein